MEAVFLKLLNMSITAGWLVLAVLLLRLVFKKAPRYLTVVMWALVGIRLVCPWSIESTFSLIPSAQPIPEQILTGETPAIHTGLPVLNNAVNPALGEVLAPTPAVEAPARSIAQFAALVWAAGVLLMGTYALVSYLRIRRQVQASMPLGGKLWLCDHLESPFILGLFRPQIYLPSDLAPEHREYVIAHEKAHLERLDHLWKPLGFVLLSIHWFNPLLWLAYVLLCRDIEAACDEAVIRKLGAEAKKPYSQALLNCSVPRRTLAACPLAFGEVSVKSRIRSVLSYKKPAFWIILAAVVACVGLSLGFLTNPTAHIDDPMKVFVDCQIAEHHQSKEAGDKACCLDWQVLDTQKRGKEITLYLWVFYGEYSFREEELYLENGSHIPTVITVEKAQGGYSLKEYWEPRDGSYYVSDIHGKFPVWLWNKATDSQRYVKQQKAACEKMAREQLEDRELTQPDQTAPPSLSALKKKYPEYFNLSTAKGLEVYVWQMGHGLYSWGLKEGRNSVYTVFELLDLKGTSLPEMQAIVASYGLPKEMVSIHPFCNPISSYAYNIDANYQLEVETLFWSTFPKIPEVDFGNVMDTMTFDIDGDGIEEDCTLGPGITSGLFSFTLSVYENGEPEYYNVFAMAFHYLSFEKMPDGEVLLRGTTQGSNSEVHYFRFGVEDGNITLTSEDQPVSPLDTSPIIQGPSTQQRLELAIADAIRNQYPFPAPEGFLFTQSYVLLDKEQVSGTPLAGQTDHAEEVKVQLLVLHMSYRIREDRLEEITDIFTSAVITFTVDAQNNHALKDYQEQELPENDPLVEPYAQALRDNCLTLAQNRLKLDLMSLNLAQNRLELDVMSLNLSYAIWKENQDLAMQIKELA